jgi:hypothetical protein
MKATILTILVLALSIIVCLTDVGWAEPVGTAFTYQGRLMYENSPAKGIFDFVFALCSSPEGENVLALS